MNQFPLFFFIPAKLRQKHNLNLSVIES